MLNPTEDNIGGGFPSHVHGDQPAERGGVAEPVAPVKVPATPKADPEPKQ